MDSHPSDYDIIDVSISIIIMTTVITIITVDVKIREWYTNVINKLN